MTECPLTNIKNECLRIEEDAIHSAKGHYNAAFIWSCMHYIVGIPLTVIAAWTGLDVISNDYFFAPYLALTTAALAALQTFLGASEKSSQHRSSAGEYLSLRNQTRLFRKIQINHLEINEVVKNLNDYAESRNQLNSLSRVIPFVAFWLARRGIDKGEAYYRVDIEDNE